MRTGARGTSGAHSDWYDLWDEMYDTVTLPHSHLYYYDVAPDSNIHDITGFYPPYNIFTHGLGMSFDPSDSAYYYYPVDTAYRPSAPFDFTSAYQLDSFWVPGEYQRHDPTTTIVDSLIIEFFVNQNPASISPDSGAYALIATTANLIYYPFTRDERPRFVTPRYFNSTDECDNEAVTKVKHQRYAFPLTSADAFIYTKTKFQLATPIIVLPGYYVASYVFFKPQVTYSPGTINYAANYYWLYAGEPRGDTTWFPQSSSDTTIGYPGSHQAGLIATNQIRYNSAGFTFNGHNVLIPCNAYANTGPNLPPGFDVPHMAFHITWPPPALIAGTAPEPVRVSAYPNPASGQLHLSFTPYGSLNVSLSLFDATGRVITTRQAAGTSGEAVIDVSALPSGLYLYCIETEGVRATGKVTVLH